MLEEHRAGSTIHADGVRWLEAIDDRLNVRVARLGLAEPRKAAGVVTLGALLSAFFVGVDVKPAARVRMKQAESSLVEHFTDARVVATIGEADAEAWRAKLKELGYSPATISRTVLYARQFFRWAIRQTELAAGHDLQVTDADCTRATGTGKAAANPATHTRPAGIKASEPRTQNPKNPAD